MRIASIGSSILMLGHQGMALFDRRRRYGLVERSKSLGVDVETSRAQALLSGSLFLVPEDPAIELSATLSVPCLPACHYAPP